MALTASAWIEYVKIKGVPIILKNVGCFKYELPIKRKQKYQQGCYSLNARLHGEILVLICGEPSWKLVAIETGSSVTYTGGLQQLNYLSWKLCFCFFQGGRLSRKIPFCFGCAVAFIRWIKSARWMQTGAQPPPPKHFSCSVQHKTLSQQQTLQKCRSSVARRCTKHILL